MDLTNLNFSVIGTVNTVTTNAGSALTVTFIFCVCAENITLPALLHCVSWTLELQALHIKILLFTSLSLSSSSGTTICLHFKHTRCSFNEVKSTLTNVAVIHLLFASLKSFTSMLRSLKHGSIGTL